jgi:hypothetical protein
MPSWLDDIRFCYSVCVDPTRVLSIHSAQELDTFTETFGLVATKIDPDWLRYGIDWAKVAQQYGGIEVIPYCYECRLDGISSAWYCSWDVASGCCWDTDAIRLELLAERG